MENLYQGITWSINEPPNYDTIQSHDPVNDELIPIDADEQRFNLLNAPLNLQSPNLVIYYPISRYSEQLYPITYNLSGQLVTPLSLLQLIYTFYNTPLSEDSFRELAQFGESEPDVVEDIIQDAAEDNEPLVTKDLLLSRVFFEGLYPYGDGYEVIIGS